MSLWHAFSAAKRKLAFTLRKAVAVSRFTETIESSTLSGKTGKTETKKKEFDYNNRRVSDRNWVEFVLAHRNQCRVAETPVVKVCSLVRMIEYAPYK